MISTTVALAMLLQAWLPSGPSDAVSFVGLELDAGTGSTAGGRGPAERLPPQPPRAECVARSPRAASTGARDEAARKASLADGEHLLRLECLAEARAVFESLLKWRDVRGQALVGLAEISFLQKDYAAAVSTAQRAAANGGGVRARVLEGDADFRLGQFGDAAKAYQRALALDPSNMSAKAGLALATKRM